MIFFDSDVCEGITCNRDEVCVARNGQPLCNCDPDCSDVDLDQPVCGSDRQTYTNECTFKMNRCQERRDVELAYYGQCQGKLSIKDSTLVSVSRPMCISNTRYYSSMTTI